MKRLRFLVVGVVLLVMVVLLVIPALGKANKFIDNSNPPGLDPNPGLDGRVRFDVRPISAGNSGNTILVDPIHICGSGRGG